MAGQRSKGSLLISITLATLTHQYILWDGPHSFLKTLSRTVGLFLDVILFEKNKKIKNKTCADTVILLNSVIINGLVLHETALNTPCFGLTALCAVHFMIIYLRYVTVTNKMILTKAIYMYCIHSHHFAVFQIKDWRHT